MSKPKTTYDSAVLRLAREERAAALAKPTDPAEAARRALADHERVIESAVRSFVDMGRALLAIRMERLYAEEFSTFSDYCDARWDISETHANRVINAALVAIEATPIGVEINSEAVARELVGLDREQIRGIWDEATRRVAGGRVTAALVKEVRRALEHPTIDGETVESDQLVARSDGLGADSNESDSGENAQVTGDRGAQNYAPAEDPTDEESDPVVPVASSSAPSDGLRVTSGGAPAEQVEPASSPPADERPQAEAGVTQPAAAPQPVETDEAKAERERLEFRTDRTVEFADALVNLTMRLGKDPIAWYEQVYLHDAYPDRHLPQVADCFEPKSLHRLATFLDALGEHLTQTGKTL